MAVQAGRSGSDRKPSNDKETTVLTYLEQMVTAHGPFGLLTSGLLVVNTAMRVGRDYPVSNCGAKYCYCQITTCSKYCRKDPLLCTSV